MTLPTDFLDNYIQVLTKYQIKESGTIACRAECHHCLLNRESDGSCMITAVANTFNLPYIKFETTIVHPLVAETHPELLL